MARPSTDAHVSLLAPEDRSRAAQVWTDLEAAGASGSLTCSWAWTQTWLEHFGDVVPHRFAIADGGCALLTFSGDRLRGRCLHVGTAGEPHGSSVFVEQNAVTVMPGAEDAFAGSLLRAARELGGWDSLILDGFRPPAALPFTREGRWKANAEVCPVTDLARVRVAGGDMTAVLSSNRRRRARRALRDLPDLEEEWCDAPGRALEAFEELAGLNRARWRAAGRHTPFEDERFMAFHRALLGRLAATGEAWVFRIRREQETLAGLYCLRDGDRALFYQSGVRELGDNRLRPGIAAHVRSIEACAARGLEVYDFLAPADRYKEDLATGADQLVWARLERARPAAVARRAARAFRRSLHDPA